MLQNRGEGWEQDKPTTEDPRRAEIERESGKSDTEAKGRNSFLVTLSDRRTKNQHTFRKGLRGEEYERTSESTLT